MPKLSRRLKHAIKSVLEYNPPQLYENCGSYPRLYSPITFYDKHLDPQLALQRVLVIPSLAADISLAAERALDAYKYRTDVKLPSVDELFPEPGKTLNKIKGVVDDARLVGLVYQDGTAISASTVASMLLLHPNSPEWSESLLFLEHSAHRSKAYDALNEDYAPKFMDPYDEEDPESVVGVSKETWQSMDEVTQRRFREAYKRFPIAAVWQIFFVRREARRALKRMENVISMRYPTFHTKAPGCGPVAVTQPSTPDAKHTAWGTPVATLVEINNPQDTKVSSTINATSVASPPRPSLRRSVRISNTTARVKDSTKSAINKKTQKVVCHFSVSSPQTSAKSDRQWSDVTIPIVSQPPPNISDDEMAIAILQHAWARAVERDSTFIVLHCGTWERIAFRHRSSRTLFLSELIDVENSSGPGYGAIHVGLFISIIADVFDRIEQLEDTELTRSPKKRKRKQSPDTHETSKRLKTRSVVALEAAKRLSDQANFEIVSTEVLGRQLALLRIQHHQYNSSSPASFLRCTTTMKTTKTTYKANEYFVVTLTSQIGDGATGDAHAGVIDLLAADGTACSFSNVVVKFALHADQRQRIRHEFKVYQHLESSGVTGIPYVFGLFKDVEGDTLALVMTNVGKSLAHRRPDPRKFEFSILKEERDKLIETLKSIHAAGVRHRDIRAENLVIGDDGTGNIIDFDRAKLNPSELTMKRELDHLISVLDGRDYSASGLEFISKGSFRDSEDVSVGMETSGWEDLDENSNLPGSDSDGTSETEISY